MTETIYKIPAPYSNEQQIEVYGDPENGWYEFRIVDKNGTIRHETNQQYGQAEIALRDALIYASDEPAPVPAP